MSCRRAAGAEVVVEHEALRPPPNAAHERELHAARRLRGERRAVHEAQVAANGEGPNRTKFSSRTAGL